MTAKREEGVQELDPELKMLLQERADAKKAKDWAAADRIRAALKAKGFVVKDTPQGPVLEKN